MSQSIAKTITAMLFGIAVKDGKIRSLDDRAQDYVPDLKGSAYGETSLRALLTMSSGVAWSETYGPGDDISKFGRDLFRPEHAGRRGPAARLQQPRSAAKAPAFTTPAARPRCSAWCLRRRPASA